ncbi:hypothetical protein BSKO_10582 [Bryopsis sp. KO-2023]|nr:hypothetical protein BSKO_10582 [Bryopsis sp. KO-2023]
MPQFRAFGRKWFFASDDLPFLAFWGAFFHGIWAVILVLAAREERPSGCDDANTRVSIFLFGLIASFVTSLVMDIFFIFIGLRGTMFETGRRYRTLGMLYLMVSNFLLKIGFTAYGTHLIFTEMPSCITRSSKFEGVMKGVIISTWVIIALFVLLTFLTYKIGSTIDSLAGWEKRVRCLNISCCGGFSRNEEALAQAAWVFADFFQPIDFTPIDTITAMILAAHRQRFHRETAASGASRPRRPTWFGVRSTARHSSGGLSNLAEAVSTMSQDHRSSSGFNAPSPLVSLGEDGGLTEAAELQSDIGLEHEQGRGGGEGQQDQHIEIVVMGSQDDDSRDDANNYHTGDEVQPGVSPASRRRRIRNLAMDLSNFDVSMVGFPEEGAMGLDSGASSGLNDLGSPCPLSESPIEQAMRRDRAKRMSPLDDGVQESDGEGEGDLEGDSRLELTSPRSMASVVSQGSGTSVNTTLTWGDSSVGPFLTPPAGVGVMSVDSGQVPLEHLEKMLKYHRYAIAAYGALLYVASGSMGSFLSRCLSLCIKATPPNVVRRNLRQMRNKTGRSSRVLLRDVSLIKRLDNEAILRWGLKQSDVIHRSYTNGIAEQQPYFITLDREDRAVVVAVRGTMSWADLVTDFLIRPEPLTEDELREVEGLLQDVKGGTVREDLPEEDRVSVHKGILASARAMVKDLEESGILQLLDGSRSPDLSIAKEDIRGWQLIFTGHSLGAGVAALASLLLRKRFVNLHCYAVSPPGGLMSPELANAMAPFCTSLLHGKDMIPRLSPGSTERLRDQMVQAVAQCRHSKMRILLGALFKKRWSEDELFLPADQVSEEAHTAYQSYKASVERSSQEDTLCIIRKFVAPGRIMFLRPCKRPIEEEGSSMKIERSFEAVWTTGKDVAKEGILMSAHMFTDHFPFTSIESLQSIITAQTKQIEAE